METEKFVLVPLSLWENRSGGGSKQNIATLDRTISHHTETKPLPQPQPPLADVNVAHDRILKDMTGHLWNVKSQIAKILLANSRISLSQNDEIILDGTNTHIEAKDFINNLVVTRGSFPDLYASLLDLLKIPSSLIKNKDALKTHRGDWIPWRK